MKINGIKIVKEGFMYDGSRFHVCNEDESVGFTDEFVKYYPKSELEKMYNECADPFKFIYYFRTLKTIVKQGERAVFEY